ncbi:hypothetical protein A0H81_02932 [Grifola frondosa]|uniref:Uncharacterized protein n=1 Tax=Grifola frondosa TaxID=5627 RepID=A0A1C7MIQ3_GRIFR|nr:hypothetical protein A0H81_02932 [Grifola frondosa]
MCVEILSVYKASHGRRFLGGMSPTACPRQHLLERTRNERITLCSVARTRVRIYKAMSEVQALQLRFRIS